MLLPRGMCHFRRNMCYFHGECATFGVICATFTRDAPLLRKKCADFGRDAFLRMKTRSQVIIHYKEGRNYIERDCSK